MNLMQRPLLLQMSQSKPRRPPRLCKPQHLLQSWRKKTDSAQRPLLL